MPTLPNLFNLIEKEWTTLMLNGSYISPKKVGADPKANLSERAGGWKKIAGGFNPDNSITSCRVALWRQFMASTVQSKSKDMATRQLSFPTVMSEKGLAAGAPPQTPSGKLIPLPAPRSIPVPQTTIQHTGMFPRPRSRQSLSGPLAPFSKSGSATGRSPYLHCDYF